MSANSPTLSWGTWIGRWSELYGWCFRSSGQVSLSVSDVQLLRFAGASRRGLTSEWERDATAGVVPAVVTKRGVSGWCALAPRCRKSLKINKASVRLLSKSVLISVRSVVQLYPGPFTSAAPAACRRLRRWRRRIAIRHSRQAQSGEDDTARLDPERTTLDSRIRGNDAPTNTGMTPQPITGMTHQPVTGMTHQPVTGMTHQPNTGMTHQPITGMTPQPITGMTHQPITGMTPQPITG
jgi:hypothetical protein